MPLRRQFGENGCLGCLFLHLHLHLSLCTCLCWRALPWCRKQCQWLVWSGLADWASSGKKELSARVYVAFQNENHLKRPHHLREQLLF